MQLWEPFLFCVAEAAAGTRCPISACGTPVLSFVPELHPHMPGPRKACPDSRFPLCGGTELSAHTAQTIHCVLFNTPPRCVPDARLVPGRAAAGTELCWEATRHYLFHPNEKKCQAPTAPALTHTSEQPMRR